MFFCGRPLRWQPLHTFALALTVAGATLVPQGLLARDAAATPETVALTALPAQAQQTQRLILAGGPFPYAKDGSPFGNRERALAARPRGFYREYTVPTPGAPGRGARRIVCGGLQANQPEACFYTADHYASFRRIVP